MKYFFYFETFILVVFNIFLLNFPITNTLGFEFALLNGIIISFLSGFLFLHYMKLLTVTTEPGLFKPVLIADTYFLLIPLLLSLVTLPFIRNCSLFQGLLFYIVLTFPSLIIGTGLACLCYLISTRFSKTVFVFLYLLVVSLPVFEIYLLPHIYFYNPILSYYPGTIYDESIPLDIKLISYRILNILYFGAVIFVTTKYLKQAKVLKTSLRVLLVLISLIIAVLFVTSKDTLGFSTSVNSIKKELRGVLETKHFIIYYDKTIERKEIENIGLHHEYYLMEASEYFEVKPSQKITSFIFANPVQKKKLIGSETADIAKPWLHYIYINYNSFEHSLKHEIAHVITGEFGVTPFKVAHFINPALIEGAATAADDNYNENKLHYIAGLAYNNNFRIPINKLFTGLNFFGELSTLSYIYSGSFIRYLISEYGLSKFKEVYRTGNFELIYRKPVTELQNEYFSFIQNYGKDNYNEAVYFFGRKPIFLKVCPHFISERTSNAWDTFKLGIYDESAFEFSSLLKYSDSYSALSGYIYSLVKLKEYRKALKTILLYKSKYDNTAYFYNIEYLTAEVLGLNKQFKNADSLYLKINRQKPSREFEYLTEFRHELIQDTASFYNYCTGSNFDKYKIIRRFYKDSLSSSSIPVIIELSKELNENYNNFISDIPIFSKGVEDSVRINSYPGSYAVYELSKYALLNEDIERAKIFGELSVKNNLNDENYKEVLHENYEKILWFEKFAKTEKMSFIWKRK